jgi:hypothetical protein
MSNGYWALRDLDQALNLDKKHQKSVARRKNACNMILLQGLQTRQDTPTNRYHLIHFQTMWALVANRKRFRPSRMIVAEDHPIVTNEELLSLCAVCFQRPLSIALVPCGHMLCKKCARLAAIVEVRDPLPPADPAADSGAAAPPSSIESECECQICKAKVLSQLSLDFVQ